MTRLSGVRLAFVVAAAIVAVAAVGAVAATATPYDRAAVTSAALDALSHQYDGVVATTPLSAANPRFTGAAASAMEPMLAQQRRNYAAGEDYPGLSEFSNVKILAISGTSSSARVDLQAHEKLSNMRNGAVVNYSEGEMVYHLVMDLVDGRWVVSQLDWEFAPGYRP